MENLRTIRFLEAIFSAADVDRDGVLTFDEFSDVVRRVDPQVSSVLIAQMFAEAIQLSNSGDSIQPDVFAQVVIKNGLLNREGANVAESTKQTPKQSLLVLRDLWEFTYAKEIDNLQETSDLAIVSLMNDLEGLLKTKSPDETCSSSAWQIYEQLTTYFSLGKWQGKAGTLTEHGGVVDAEEEGICVSFKQTSASSGLLK